MVEDELFTGLKAIVFPLLHGIWSNSQCKNKLVDNPQTVHFTFPILRKDWPFLAHLSWKLKWAILIACCPSSVRKLLHFRLLLQNHWANFNQTWHKSSLGEGDSKIFKWRGLTFSKER
jgi:hypothetical protein